MKSRKKKGIELFEMWLGCGLYVQHFAIIKIESSFFLKQDNPYNQTLLKFSTATQYTFYIQTQSLTMINVCTLLGFSLMSGWERGMSSLLTSQKSAYSPPTGKFPPKPNFYSAFSKVASPTTE